MRWNCVSHLFLSQTDRLFALSRLKQSGAFLTTTEGVMLQLIQDAKHPNFKEVPHQYINIVHCTVAYKAQ